MLEMDVFKQDLIAVRKMLAEAGESLQIDHLREQLVEYNEDMGSPGFWDDTERAQKVSAKASSVESRIKHYESLISRADDIEVLMELVGKYNVRAEYSCGDLTRIQRVLAYNPKALINYDGNTTEQDLEAVCALVPKDQLTVWMYYDNPHFAWLTDRFKASPENCACVKKYAQLGIANVRTPYEMRDAIRFGADVIEPF